MNWLHILLIVGGTWIAIDQGRSFFRARRTGITYVGVGEEIPVLKTENPGLFGRNVWSRAITAVLMMIIVIFFIVTDLRSG